MVKSSLSDFSEVQKHSIMMWYANFPKKSLFELGTILATIMKPYSRDLLFGNFFKRHGMMVCNSQTKAVLVNSCKNLFFREVNHIQFGPKLSYRLSDDLLFQDFLKCCSMKEYVKRHFPVLGKLGNSDPIWVKFKLEFFSFC